MGEYNTIGEAMPAVLRQLWSLLEGMRGAFRQERTYLRAVAMVYGELFTFGRHTVTQVLRTLGETEQDWSAWYRLFSRERYVPAVLAGQLLGETLKHVPEEEPYTVTLDGVRIRRSGAHVAGSGWWLALHTAPFQRGLERGQRFVECAWLTPLENGFSRALPLCWEPAVTERGLPSEAKPCKEWEAGWRALCWVREEMNARGRGEQWLLAVGDGKYDVQGIWGALPERTVLLVRCAKNRALYALPGERSAGPGRPRQYGERLKSPREWLHAPGPWRATRLTVRGRGRALKYRVLGPLLVEGASGQPLYLLVVRGGQWWAGGRRRYRAPAFYLVSAVAQEGGWALPWPAEKLLQWAWQRWECEVAHREMKSALGIGEKQCWGPRSALTAVQWGVWLYALCVLAAYRTWGLTGGPRRAGRWYPHASRWSFTAMWQAYREALWQLGALKPLCSPILANWLKTELWQSGLSNAVASAGRI